MMKKSLSFIKLNSFILLELPELLECLSSLAQTKQGADKCRSLVPCFDYEKVKRRQRRLSQLKKALDETNSPELDGLDDFLPIIRKLKKNRTFLLSNELKKILTFFQILESGISFLDKVVSASELFLLRKEFLPLRFLSNELSRIVEKNGKIKNTASLKLDQIRKKINKQKKILYGEFSSLLENIEFIGTFSDKIITQRKDRFVLPVKKEARKTFLGIVHDVSQSGATSFIEPLSMVERNNVLASLYLEELEEEKKILKEISLKLFENFQDLFRNFQALIKLDCLLAQSFFSKNLKASRPILNEKGYFELFKARHPLLAWREKMGEGFVSPVEIKFSLKWNALVFSGANAAGKTVVLKTVGLIHLMALCGLQIPCAPGSSVNIYKHIFVEMGDNQSLRNKLSTFSAHATNLKEILNSVSSNSLILIDELGMGTDPSEGVAIAIAYLEWIIDVGGRIICTTHFYDLKVYASENKKVENVSISLKKEDGKFRCRLFYGSPGFSEALLVSEELGFPRKFVSRARDLVGFSTEKIGFFLRKIRKKIQEVELQYQILDRERVKIQFERKQSRELLEIAKIRKIYALKEGKTRVRKIIKQLESQLFDSNNLLEKKDNKGSFLEKGKIFQGIYKKRREFLNVLDRNIGMIKDEKKSEVVPDIYNLGIGSIVSLVGLNQTGILLEKIKPGLRFVTVSIGEFGIKVKASLNEIRLVDVHPKPLRKKRSQIFVSAEIQDNFTIKVEGYTVEEASLVIDKVIDQALLAGRQSISVIHGVGTGRLRKGVRKYLKEHPYIKEIVSKKELKNKSVTLAIIRY